MKFIMNTVLVFIVVSHIGLCLAMAKAADASVRKSKPPIKLVPGDKIIHRKDICNGIKSYPSKNTIGNVEASPRLAYTIR